MNPTFDHSLISSLKEYIDHKIVEKLGAWKNSTIRLYADTNEDRLNGFKRASAGPQQWLYDSSISGAIIASPAQFSGAWSGAKTDFRNSRFLLPNSISGVYPTSGTVALKHFNSYVSSKDDEELFQNTTFEYPPEMFPQNTFSKPDSYHAPCYFVKFSMTDNIGFELGGADKTSIDIKITCFAKTESELLSIGSTIRDLKNTDAIILNSTPLNEFNDLKTKPWNYHSQVDAAIASGNSRIFIEKSRFNPIKSDNINSKLKNIYVGLGNMTVSVIRYPRA